MCTLEELRKKIEQIDANIIEKLAQREELSKQIGQLKSEDGTLVIDSFREKKLFEFYEHLCDKYKLPQAFVKRLFKTIIIHSRTVQKL